MWRLLYILRDRFRGYGFGDWSEAGDCVVIKDRFWYSKVLEECPESLITGYRTKLAKQGTLRLEDIAAFAVELDRRRLRVADWNQSYIELPRDLDAAGLYGAALSPEGLLLYAALTPEQRDKARTAAGLAYEEMTQEQRLLVKRAGRESRAGNATHDIVRPAVSQEELQKAVLRITQSHLSVTKPGLGDALGAGEYTNISLMIEFPNGYKTGCYVALKVTSPAARGK